MHKIIIVLLLTMTISTIASGQSPINHTENKDNDISNWDSINEDTYQIKYPSNWDVNKSGQMGTSFILSSRQSNKEDNFKENVNLIIQDITAYNLNLDQYVAISEEQINTLITEGKIILTERKQKDGEEYHRVIYTGKQGIYNLKFEQYYWVIENQAFILTLTCEKDEFDKYQEIGETILNSFEIK